MTHKPFEGMLDILVFNWPLYAAALLLALACPILLFLLPLPPIVALLLLASAAGAGYFLIVSLAVSYIIYDRSPLYRWQWIKDVLPFTPRQIVNLHAGFDKSSPALRALFPDANMVVLDFYDRHSMTEASIARARRLELAHQQALSVDPAALPLADNSCSTAFLLFAAHEIRDARQRLQLFCEVKRILEAKGSLLLVEHNRNLANFLAFGPGFLHFYPQSEWLRLATKAGLQVTRSFTCTPFVRILLLQKEAAPYEEAKYREKDSCEQSSISVGAISR
ncbi:MAG TPA: class I SAM-dependent methyltransferase [Ktedonosporobacter sp.]|nr:class I SAM-dependent methyltransferase [Ktedonosporobacter sp.]